jgi:hypothetical protein
VQWTRRIPIRRCRFRRETVSFVWLWLILGCFPRPQAVVTDPCALKLLVGDPCSASPEYQVPANLPRTDYRLSIIFLSLAEIASLSFFLLSSSNLFNPRRYFIYIIGNNHSLCFPFYTDFLIDPSLIGLSLSSRPSTIVLTLTPISPWISNQNFFPRIIHIISSHLNIQI